MPSGSQGSSSSASGPTLLLAGDDALAAQCRQHAGARFVFAGHSKRREGRDCGLQRHSGAQPCRNYRAAKLQLYCLLIAGRKAPGQSGSLPALPIRAILAPRRKCQYAPILIQALLSAACSRVPVLAACFPLPAEVPHRARPSRSRDRAERRPNLCDRAGRHHPGRLWRCAAASLGKRPLSADVQ